MASRVMSDDELRIILDAYEAHGRSDSKASDALGIKRQTFHHRRLAAQKLWPEQPKPFEAPILPNMDLPTQELIAWRKKQFERRREAETARKLIPVKVNLDGPIGIVHFGDPHVDDDGTDIAKLEEDVNTVKKTEGLFAANLGDLQNNWVGRLARLYAEQSTSQSQAWQLTEWLATALPWLYIVGGNHDLWSGAGDPLKWITRQAGTMYEAWGVRAGLNFPNGKQVRVNARHDFRGHSMWNINHGPGKAIQMGWRDHILTCGHKHESFVTGPYKDPAAGLLSWAIRCCGYKAFDRYGKELGLPDQNSFSACVTIIDPQYADDDTRLITVIPDVQEGAEFLKFKRKRR